VRIPAIAPEMPLADEDADYQPALQIGQLRSRVMRHAAIVSPSCKT